MRIVHSRRIKQGCRCSGQEGADVRARLVYWLPFTLLAVALAVVIYTVAHAGVVHALDGVATP
jgi:hypothetical protein